jgi:hypothetical protein
MISLIKVVPGIPSLYVRKTDIKEEKGINIRKNRTAISKIVVLVMRANLEVVDSRIDIENRKKSCE